MILILSIPRLLSTTGRYRRRTLLVGTRRAGRDMLNALVRTSQPCENGDGRRGAGNTTDGLTHHSPTREGGLS